MGTRARDEINASTGAATAEFLYCDLSSQQQVRALAADINARYDALHILVNNAGITDPVRRLSVDGIEMHLATCHLAHFLLTHLLLDLIKRSAPARIINISSDEAAGMTGKCVEHGREKAMGKPAADAAMRQKVWLESEQLTGVNYQQLAPSIG